MRHRILVYWGLRDDPELDDQWTTQGVDRRTQLVGLPLGVAALVCTLMLVDLLVRLVTGADIDLGRAFVEVVRLAGAMLGLLAVGNVVFGVVGWLRTHF